MMARAGTQDALDGWKEILQCIESLSSMKRCVRTMMRWSRLRVDPMPVYRSPGGRSVHTSRKAVTRWWWRNRRLLEPVSSRVTSSDE